MIISARALDLGLGAMIVGLWAIVVVTVRRRRPVVEKRQLTLATEAVVLGCLMIGVAHMVRR
jgi:hypothetical protein